MEERMNMRGGGTLTLRREGLRLHLEAERPADDRGLYKVWLHGDQGGKYLLGTLSPEQGRLRLRRMVSVGTLERAGCWPQFWAEAALSFSFQRPQGGQWYCEPRPGRLVADPLLKELLRDSMLCKQEEDGFALAAPFRTDCPAPLTPLLCLARVECWDGRAHLVWSFDRDGCPKITNKTERSGQTNPQ